MRLYIHSKHDECRSVWISVLILSAMPLIGVSFLSSIFDHCAICMIPLKISLNILFIRTFNRAALSEFIDDISQII